MLTTVTILHGTLGQLYTSAEMKILLAGQETEHHYDTIPQRPGLLRRLVPAILARAPQRTQRT